MPDELAFLDATAQAELIRRGELSPAELVDAAIDRIEELDPAINAVVIRLFDQARAAASSRDLPDGPFRGVPFLLKDLGCEMANAPHHSGMRFLRDLGWVADGDSSLAARFREAGLVVLGRTNTPELGGGMTTEPLSYGPTRNPWDTSRSSGGSSGGSAAAVAAGMVPAAHGGDGGGSLRIPASECGLVGLKVSRGRVSGGGDEGADLGLSVHGVLTRSVRDTAALVDLIAGDRPGDAHVARPLPGLLTAEVGADPGRLRVGFTTSTPAQPAPTDPECVAAVEAAARLLEELGVAVEQSHPAPLDDMEVTLHYATLYMSGTAARVDAWGERTGRVVPLDQLESSTRLFVEMGRSLSAPQVLRALGWLQGFTRRMAQWWSDDGFDVLLTPTLTGLPPKIGEMVTQENPVVGLARGGALVPFTPPFNVTGQPAMSLPLHWSSEGLPIGVQLVADHGREDVLVRLAARLEEARPWAARRPAVAAASRP